MKNEQKRAGEGGGGSFSVSLKREWGKGGREIMQARESQRAYRVYRLTHIDYSACVHVYLGEMQKIQLCMQDLFTEFPAVLHPHHQTLL